MILLSGTWDEYVAYLNKVPLLKSIIRGVLITFWGFSYFLSTNESVNEPQELMTITV